MCGRYDTRTDMKFESDAPVVGLVLQRSHLVTGDEGHYSGVVSEMESRGAKVRFSPLPLVLPNLSVPDLFVQQMLVFVDVNCEGFGPKGVLFLELM